MIDLNRVRIVLATALTLGFVAPSVPPQAEAATQKKVVEKKQKKPAAAKPRRKNNFRAARPDEFPRIFGCDDFSLSIQPTCVDGRLPYFRDRWD